MNNVTSLSEIKSSKISSDFQKQDIVFDIDKLRNACNEVLKIKGFDTSLGIPHFAGIAQGRRNYTREHSAQNQSRRGRPLPNREARLLARRLLG